jgi:capsid protein
MNDLHDLDDLQQYEMTAAKDAASVTNVITNAAGEAMSAAQMRRTKLQVQTTDASGNPVTKNADQYFEVLTGARNVMLKNGEDMKQFQSNRPSVATREYWDYLTAKICAGVGISRLLVFPYSMQGTVTRADLDVSAVFFRSRSKIIETAFREIYIWVMQWACTFDSRLAGYPKADWFKANARPPRSPNVDVGRNSAAVIAETEAGLRTYQDNYAELGEDWRQQFEQRAQERAYAHQLAEKYGLDVNEIAALTIASNASEAQPVERGGGSIQSATP